MEHNMVGWFEIPVNEMDRAKKFYEEVFRISISVHDLGDITMGWFPGVQGKPGSPGSLVKHEMYTPSNSKGPLLYFSCKDLTNEMSRIIEAGGKILQDKTAIGEGNGYMSLFLDSEGNRMAMHSQV